MDSLETLTTMVTVVAILAILRTLLNADSYGKLIARPTATIKPSRKTRQAGSKRRK